MYLVYRPDNGSGEQRWEYNPRKLKATDREMLEQKTNRNFSQFASDVMQGNSLCRRALLFLYLRRDHPKTRWDDVDFTWDELDLEYSKQELGEIREQASENLTGSDREAALKQLDSMMADAYDDPDAEGKANLPIVA